jgi:iron complex outermembrane receptor protein
MRYLIITFLFLNSLIFSQEIQIRGKVVNQSDGSPLYLANVVIEGQTQGIPTERNGEFSLSGDFDPDTYIILSYLGFETKKLQISDLLTDGINEIGLVRKVLSSQTIFVEGSIGKVGRTPSTFSKIDRQNISESYTTQDIPEFLSYLPSTTFYSESGHGIGYNYISIRGFDQRRISVAINGIVQNDPEDHNVYWLDLPDLLESTELVQVQRGAGAGAIGYPSVGGSINIITSPFSDKQRVEFGSIFGSYNTRKYSAVFSSGMIDNKYSVYAKISNILSSGYRDKS